MRRVLLGALATALLAGGCAVGPGSTGSAGEAGSPIPSAGTSASAPGPSSSSTPSQPSGLELVALGDSIAASKLCECDRYPEVYSQLAAGALGQAVRPQNMAVNGATSADLRYRLENVPEFPAAIREATLITISIGLNDIESCVTATDADCYDTAVSGLKANLEAIFRQIDDLQGTRPHILRAPAYYNIYAGVRGTPQSDPSFQKLYAKELDRVNATICAAVVAHHGLCIDLLSPFNGPNGDQDAGSLLANDHVHPSATGHEVIAKAIDAAGYAPLRP